MSVSIGKRIVPIWHHIDVQTIMRHSPLLVDLSGIPTFKGIEPIVDMLVRLLTEIPNSGGAVIKVDQYGSSVEVDELFVFEARRSMTGDHQPLLQLDIHKHALFNGIGLTILGHTSRDCLFVYVVLPETGDARKFLASAEEALAKAVIDRDAYLVSQLIRPIINRFHTEIELGVAAIFSITDQKLLYEHDDTAQTISEFVTSMFYMARNLLNPPFAQISSDKREGFGIRLDIWNDLFPELTFIIELADEERRWLYSATGISSMTELQFTDQWVVLADAAFDLSAWHIGLA